MARKALVIGIDHYPSFYGLKTAGEDALRIDAALREHGGFDVTPCSTRTRSANLREAILTFLHQVEARDLGLLYFAGHALEVRGEGFLLASDATGEGATGGISLQNEVYNRVKPGANLLVVLDCCQAGASAPLTGGQKPAGSVLVLGASGPREFVLDAGGGALTREFCALMGGAPVKLLAGFELISQAATEANGGTPVAWMDTGGSWPGNITEFLNPKRLTQGPSTDNAAALTAYRQSVLDTVRVPSAPWEHPDSVLDDGEIDRLIVPLSLRGRPSDDEQHELIRHDRPWRLEDLVDLDLEANPWANGRWLVQGGPGAGKSTMLRRLARDLAAPSSPWVPVWAPLPWVAGLTEPLLDMRAAPCCDVAPGLAALLDAEARGGRAVLLCDGLDEVLAGDTRDLALARLHRWAAEWPGPIIVAGRRHGVTLDGPFVPVDVQPLGPEQQLDLVRERLGGGTSPPRFAPARTFLESHRDRLGELAGNPFYLTLLALVFKTGERPGATPAALYLKAIDTLLRGKHRREANGRRSSGVRNPPRTLEALSRLALRMTEEASSAESADEAHQDTLEDWLDDDPACHGRAPLDLLADVDAKAGFLVRERPERWRFLHRSFREVLCARALVDQLGTDPTALQAKAAQLTKADDLALWANPWALAAGLLDDPDPLLRALLDANEALAIDALLNAYAVSRETFAAFLTRPLPDDDEEVENRRRVYLAAAEKLPNAAAALALVGDLVSRRLAPDERWFLDELCDVIKARWPAVKVESIRRSIYADLPAAHDGLVRWSEVIPAGRFWMGSPEGVGYGDEHPRHLVTLTRSYQLDTTPVTNRQWRAFDPQHEPYAWKGVPEAELPDHPVVLVSWYAAQAFCRWLSLSCGRNVRLPTEAEWERACRGPNGEDEANRDRWWFGDDEARLNEHAWYDKNSDRRTHTVGTTPAGAGPWGLHDMHGNVWEWCSDWFSRDSYVHAAAGGGNVDPKGPSGGDWRVMRGGGCWYVANWCRSAFRNHWRPAVRNLVLGFRVLLPAAPGT